jgi:hypothetical protein
VRRIAAVLLLLAACGKEPEKDPLETPQYFEWRQTQALRQLPMAMGGMVVPGKVEVQPPQNRSKNRGDFVELFLNGNKVGRYNVAKLPDGNWPRIAFDIDFNSGPNTFDVWDTTSNRYYRQQVDTRNCTHFLFVPTADGYEIQQIGAKIKDD